MNIMKEKEYILLGPTPPDENCAQLGEPNYRIKAIKECNQYIDLIRQTLGQEPAGAELKIKAFDHDLGVYHEVVCYYDNNKQASLDYALKCESNGPKTWKD